MKNDNIMTESKINKKCIIKSCNNNLDGVCKLETTIFENGVCMDNTKNNEKSNVEIRLFNHSNNKVHYQRLTNLQLYLIHNILRKGIGGI